MTITGTGLSECAVSGEPSSSSISSALPWSAVMSSAPPVSCTAATTSPRQRVDGLDRLDRRRDHAGVADHVGVGEVDDPERRLVLAPGGDERVGGLARAHLGLVVVGRHVARRGHELAPLARLGLLLAAAEEVRHVRVLLGLGDVQLLGAACRRSPASASSPGAPAGRRPATASPPRTRSASCSARPSAPSASVELAHAVGAEVEGDDRVLRADARLVADRRRGDELVAALVALVGCRARPAAPLSAWCGGRAVEQQVERRPACAPRGWSRSIA